MTDRLDTFRTEVREFLRASLPPGWRGIGALSTERELFIEEWRQKLVEHGYIACWWPKEYGGAGRSEYEAAILAEEFAVAAAPTGAPNDAFGIDLLGGTLLMWGTEAQKGYYLPRIISGVDRWCQGYSEPEAGSDLANLRCRAELDGDEWVINGQKIWTSRAQTATAIFVLARTNSAPDKHQGISFLLCPLDSPGIEIRPIRMISGAEEFCEVFFEDARVPCENVLGGVGQGWQVAKTLLSNERGAAALRLPIEFRSEFDRLLALAQDRDLTHDPRIRQRLAMSYTRVEIMRYLGLRSLAAINEKKPFGPEGSIFKLCWSEHHREVTQLGLDILGAEALVPVGQAPANAIQTDDPGATNSSASWVGVFFNSRAGTIFAGTSEIQRNILGEVVLDLPREPKRELE